MKLMKFKHRLTGADLYVRPSAFAGLMVGGNINVSDNGVTRLAVSVIIDGIPSPCGVEDTIESVRKQLSANSISIDDPTPLPAD